MFSRVGRIASEDVVIKLVVTKCVPVILYGLDACPVNASDRHSLDFVLTRCLMKLFNTGSNAVINECMNAFQVKKMSDCVIARKLVFLIDIVNLTILYVKLCPVWLVKNSWRLAECN